MISWALWGGAAVPGRRLLLPAQLLGGGAASPKIGPSPRTPLQETFPGGAALLAAPGDEGTRPCSDSWESRPLHAQAFYGAPPGSPELINPPRKRWYSREKSFWSPAPVCTGVGLGLSPPGGSQRCHRRAVGRCAAGGRRAVPTQPPPARPRSLINLVISSLAGLRAWSPGWEQHRCSTGVLQAAQDGARPPLGAQPLRIIPPVFGVIYSTLRGFIHKNPIPIIRQGGSNHGTWCRMQLEGGDEPPPSPHPLHLAR